MRLHRNSNGIYNKILEAFNRHVPVFFSQGWHMKGWVVSVPVMKMISGRVSVTWGEAVDILTDVNNNNLK